MSVQATLDALKNRLLLAAPVGQPPPSVVYSNPIEAVSLANFPCMVLGFAPDVENSWGFISNSQGMNNYTVAIWLFVGTRQTSIQEIYGRILPWPKAIADVLAADLTLGGSVQFIGFGDDKLFNYSPKAIAWGDGNYFGLEFHLPVVETHVQTMG